MIRSALVGAVVGLLAIAAILFVMHVRANDSKNEAEGRYDELQERYQSLEARYESLDSSQKKSADKYDSLASCYDALQREYSVLQQQHESLRGRRFEEPKLEEYFFLTPWDCTH